MGWSAQSRAVPSDPSGTVTFSIDFIDIAENVGTKSFLQQQEIQ